MYIIKPGANALQHIWEKTSGLCVLQIQNGTYTLKSDSPCYEQEIEFVEIQEIYKQKICFEDNDIIVFIFDGTFIEISKEHIIEI